jgi:hypothetical protein
MGQTYKEASQVFAEARSILLQMHKPPIGNLPMHVKMSVLLEAFKSHPSYEQDIRRLEGFQTRLGKLKEKETAFLHSTYLKHID